MTTKRELKEENRALRSAVSDLYGWVVTFDSESGPVTDYLTDPVAQRLAAEACDPHQGPVA